MRHNWDQVEYQSFILYSLTSREKKVRYDKGECTMKAETYQYFLKTNMFSIFCLLRKGNEMLKKADTNKNDLNENQTTIMIT